MVTNWLNTDMQIKLNTPMNKKAQKAIRKTRSFWFSRPSALHSDTVLDRATGSPAVEMVRKKL